MKAKAKARVRARGEGEGEGEGEMSLAAMAAMLLASFTEADVNNDGSLSMAEAQRVVPALTQAEFDAMDENSDGQLSQEELEAMAGTGGGCQCATGSKNLKRYASDVFLLGASFMVLLSLSRRR